MMWPWSRLHAISAQVSDIANNVRALVRQLQDHEARLDALEMPKPATRTRRQNGKGTSKRASRPTNG